MERGDQNSGGDVVQTEATVQTMEQNDGASEKPHGGDKAVRIHDTPPQKMLKIRPNGKLASPKAAMQYQEAQMAEAPHDLEPPQKRASKIPKGNLQISANGTLHALSPELPSDTQKRRGRKKKSETETRMKSTCLAVLKYKRTDDAEMSTGGQIDKILSGEQALLHQTPEKPNEPPKSTHPFFTGELSRNPKLESALLDGHQAPATDSRGSQSRSAVLPKTHFGPRESRITSKPPGAGKQLNDIYDGSLPTFGTDYAKVTRFPGAVEPIWPPFEMVHVECIPDHIWNCANAREASEIPGKGRKLKSAPIQILPEENILTDLTNSVRLWNIEQKIGGIPTRGIPSFRRPHRKIMTGLQLQQAIRSRVSRTLSKELSYKDPMEDELSSSQPSSSSPHKSLVHLIHQLPKLRSAFDDFECETEEWSRKYAPKCAEHVLQQGREAEILRDWLKALTVSSVGGGGDESRTRDSSMMGRKAGLKLQRKKKRKTGELDDFVVEDEDEPNEMTEIANIQPGGSQNSLEKKSVMCTGITNDRERTANAVIISGPHGCGKTAAVFAVAKELDFEIFEVNAGSRRSGKDVLDKVGDMTRNHLVQHRQDTPGIDPVDPNSDLMQLDEKLQADLSSGRQGTMQSFFQVQAVDKQNVPKSKDDLSKSEPRKGRPKKKILQEVLSKPRDQKQSLILLEEVDVLFEEDKLFWATILDLLSRSKRPVIMTCSDETLVPLNDMTLYAILRFATPPTDLATDYLLLVAASEGHLLSRESVQSLYEVKGSDLRASLAELNFYCQMGIGDSKGGLEWMLLDKPDQILDIREPLRVISEDTYSSGMGWLGGEDASSQTYQTLNEVIELSAEVWDGWHIDLGATDLLDPTTKFQDSSSTRQDRWHSLRGLDESCEAFSAADILPASVVRHDLSLELDTSLPALNDQTRYNYTEGRKVLQADPVIDNSGTSNSLAFALRASAMINGQEPARLSIDAQRVSEIIPLARGLPGQPEITLLKIMTAFQPIADESSSTYAVSKNMLSSCFDGPLSTILQDVAPYVRSIVTYDLQLEEQRRQLSNLLTQPGSGNKKIRTTRASRAALEGGNKADTRRERWFPKQTDFDAVLNTGGNEWQKVASQMSLEDLENQSLGSRRSRSSSNATGPGTDI